MKHSIMGFLFGTLCLLLTGCATSPATQFYTLNAVNAEQTTQTSGAPKYRVVVGMATIPDSVNRTAMVTREGANEVRVHENQRWAESLKSEIPRVVALNISSQLPDAQVAAYPQQLALGEADFDVLLDVQAFDATISEAVVLDVQWRIQRHGENGVSVARRTRLTEKVQGDDMAEVAAAFSRALAVVSQEIASTIQQAKQ
jgi:Uncharacterized protein conserved in bacteria